MGKGKLIQVNVTFPSDRSDLADLVRQIAALLRADPAAADRIRAALTPADPLGADHPQAARLAALETTVADHQERISVLEKTLAVAGKRDKS